MAKRIPSQKKLTVFGLFFKVVLKYPGLFIGATITNIVALTLYSLVPWYYKVFFDALSSGEPKEQAAAAAIGAVFIIAVLNGIRWVSRRVSEYMIAVLQPKFMQDVTMMSFARLLGQPYRFFSNNFSGSLSRKILRLTHGMMAIDDVLNYSVTNIAVTVIVSLLLIGSRSMTLMAIFAAWLAATLVFNYFFSKRLRALRLARATKDTETSGVLVDAITNSNNVKLFSADRHELSLLNKITSELRQLQSKAWNRQNDSTFGQILVLMAVEFVVIYWCAVSWKAGTITLGDIVLAQSILLKLGELIWGLNNVFKNFYEAYADSQEMIDILNLPPEIVDAKNAKKLKVPEGAVSFESMQFNYNDTREVIADFSLDIRPKEKIALVGPSGAGKTTIVKLLFRLYDLTGGKITIDKQDISKVTQESLRDALSMVPQDPILFHRSLLENIRYGQRDASDEEVYEAAKRARCHDFISAQPEGYKTLVGERGIKLSGGERQRVAIARAILKNAPILVLDEATSSLDSESEQLIHEALHELMRDKTVIVIAHRLSTIMEMDRIAVIENGKISDMGTHDELLERAGTYKKLWEIQAGGFID